MCLFGLSLLLAALTSVGQAATRLRIETQDGRTYLVAPNRERLLLLQNGHRLDTPPAPEVVILPGGYVVSLAKAGVIAVSKTGKPVGDISLGDIRDRLLANDSFWSGHEEAAKDLRYMNKQGGGVTLVIRNMVPSGDSALALASWREDGPTNEPIVAEHLVRVQVKPTSDIQFVRRLDLAQGMGGTWLTVPRLFQSKTRLFLYTKVGSNAYYDLERAGKIAPDAEPNGSSMLEQIAADGRTIGNFMELPPLRFPIHLLDARWLVLGAWQGETRGRNEWVPHDAVWIADLLHRKAFAVPGKWVGGFDAYRFRFPDTGPWFVVQQIGYQREGTPDQVFVVTMPGPRRVALAGAEFDPGSQLFVWRGLIVVLGAIELKPSAHWMNVVKVYDPATGKLIQKLSWMLK